MIFRMFFFTVLLGVLCTQGFYARAEQSQKKLVVDIASDHIDVTVGFSGASIEVFGDRRDINTDIIIVVEGPLRNVTIWKKARIMGTWVNRHYVYFKNIPMYYNFALSNPDLLDANPALMREKRVGVNALFEGDGIRKSGGVTDVVPFRDSLIEAKTEGRIFPQSHSEIVFMNDNFFRVSFKIPPSVPTGEYTIHSYLIKKGKIVDEDVDTLKVEQVGLNAFILKAAREDGFLYSIVCIVLAVVSGWFVSAVRVRT